MLCALLVVAAVLVLPRPVRRLPGRPRSVAPPAEAATLEDAAVALVLLAAALRGGGGTLECLEAVSTVDPTPAGRELGVVAAAQRWGEGHERAWSRVGPGWAPAAAAWHAATAAGAGPAGLLDAAAERIRVAESRRVESAVQRAGVLLVLPLGLCFLPGFVATTVVPVVLLLLGSLG
ncbi:type II secretion system F family protein [Phycicoccus endophyticus]|uniref:Type II secretion system F family protein n=1 Tax=Phycicoccus endophyticus TaxID=1690220 RepID=A0A7G9QZU0_9MICO|nr:type II secretion system F family protein [Phycicoccus endophyticus]NHI20064.1 hypothetical protein [Phycicoccus endophyticus]QNN48865.1 type II secretion system F family protein [Phycicoccus endophyticus]GGL42206.1 hypothetical protein GCM10012283_25990 [Phycicoccus endophyticus]